MNDKKVKDFMIPVALYPQVRDGATMKEAVEALKRANMANNGGTQPFRAVLVVNKNKKIVGKVGQLRFLKALEPKYRQFFNMDKLTHASSQLLESLKDNFQLWGGGLNDIIRTASYICVKDIMEPVEENIDENEYLPTAIHKIIMWETLSILVSRGKEITGILRLSDIYSEIENKLTESVEE